MIIVSSAVAVLITVWVVGTLILRGWSPALLAARSRGQLITAAVDAVVVLALVRALAPPPGAWVWLWPVAAGAMGFGLAGALLRWTRTPWVPTERRPRTHRAHPARPSRIGPAWRIGLSCLYLAGGCAVIVLTT